MVELKLHIVAITITPYACIVWQRLSRLHLKSRQQEAELQKKIQHQTKRKQKSKHSQGLAQPEQVSSTNPSLQYP